MTSRCGGLAVDGDVRDIRCDILRNGLSDGAGIEAFGRYCGADVEEAIVNRVLRNER